MSTEEEILLHGFPPQIKDYYRSLVPLIPEYPEILVEIGRKHRDRGRKDYAAECWAAAMRQTTDPMAQCAAAHDTVESIALYKGSTVYQQRAKEILYHRAEQNNPQALDALLKYVKRPSPHP